MTFRSVRVAAALLAIVATTAPSGLSAQLIRSTGVNLVLGRDQSWLVSTNAGVNFGAAFFVTTPPSPPWLANTGAYAWISATESGTGAPSGSYVFREVFDLTGYNASTFGFDFRCSKDNDGGTYKLNGSAASAAVCAPLNTYSFGSTVSLNSGFVPGSNTIDFFVTGDQTTDGFVLSVDAIRATPLGTSTVPEPATMGLLATGLVSLTALRRRKK